MEAERRRSGGGVEVERMRGGRTRERLRCSACGVVWVCIDGGPRVCSRQTCITVDDSYHAHNVLHSLYACVVYSLRRAGTLIIYIRLYFSTRHIHIGTGRAGVRHHLISSWNTTLFCFGLPQFGRRGRRHEAAMHRLVARLIIVQCPGHGGQRALPQQLRCAKLRCATGRLHRRQHFPPVPPSQYCALMPPARSWPSWPCS